MVANHNAGFHKGAHGVIEYMTPNGEIWVLRDGAGSPVFYHAPELDFEDLEDGYCMSDKIFDREFLAACKNNEIHPSTEFLTGAQWAWELAREVFENQSKS